MRVGIAVCEHVLAREKDPRRSFGLLARLAHRRGVERPKFWRGEQLVDRALNVESGTLTFHLRQETNCPPQSGKLADAPSTTAAIAARPSGHGDRTGSTNRRSESQRRATSESKSVAEGRMVKPGMAP
jgi:hypothetical protein